MKLGLSTQGNLPVLGISSRNTGGMVRIYM